MRAKRNDRERVRDRLRERRRKLTRKKKKRGHSGTEKEIAIYTHRQKHKKK